MKPLTHAIFTLVYLTQAKIHSVGMVYCWNKDVATAAKDFLAEKFLSIKTQIVKKL